MCHIMKNVACNSAVKQNVCDYKYKLHHLGFFNKVIVSYQNIFHLGMATGLGFILYIYINVYVYMYVYIST